MTKSYLELINELCPDCGNNGYYTERHRSGIWNYCEMCGYRWKGTESHLRAYLKRVDEPYYEGYLK